MDKLHRCPRCAARRVEDHRFCSKCGFDYSQGLGPSRSSEPEGYVREPVVRRGEVVPAPGPSPIRRDTAYLGVPPSRSETEEIRRDIARVALARHSVRLRSAIGSILGVIGGVFVAGLLLPMLSGANALVAVAIVIGTIWLGAWIGSWLVVRSLAR
jgi:hypothetical protein